MGHRWPRNGPIAGFLLAVLMWTACGTAAPSSADRSLIEISGTVEVVPTSDTVVIKVDAGSKGGALGSRLTARGTGATEVVGTRGRQTGWNSAAVGPGLPVFALVDSVPDRTGVYTLVRLTVNAR